MQENKKLSKKERQALKKQEKQIVKEKNVRKKAMYRVIFWVIIVLVVAGAVFGVIMLALKSQPNTSSAGSVAVIAENDWVLGDADSNIELIEYSDFQCPACANYHPLIKQIIDEFGGDIKFAYRHFPLIQIHKNAEGAARAAEAAGKQGKFWEMHDMIFQKQSEWSDLRSAEDIFKGYARGLGIDVDKFVDDLESKEVKDKVTDNLRTGYEAKVNSTPTFFLKGERVQPRNYDEFKNFILQALETDA